MYKIIYLPLIKININVFRFEEEKKTHIKMKDATCQVFRVFCGILFYYIRLS